MPAADGTQHPLSLDTRTEAVKFWEERMGIDRNAPTAEQRWNALVYYNLHGVSIEEAMMVIVGGGRI
jgi:hypothetical protein